MSDIWEKLDKGSAEYFRESREKMMGSKLEDLKKGREVKSDLTSFLTSRIPSEMAQAKASRISRLYLEPSSCSALELVTSLWSKIFYNMV